ncbi:DUF732 domain-containing protein [Mycobacterium sp. Marseille-P9652]|uniref:DUF732 domain-containing protein n=1 Tax=Mycobacterium sp. Marseille-P9652 TaxID=2654950 RepID=UPI0012E8F4F5|nr:DUF732 domain-containing protein [Mycobacterium sp. Marseille-P9652]
MLPTLTALRILGVTAGMAGLTAALPAPAHADLMGDAFLRALTNAGVPVAEPGTATALGQSVCPDVVRPGGTFDSAVAAAADASGMSQEAAGVFSIIAIATYCPALLAPLLSNRLPG